MNVFALTILLATGVGVYPAPRVEPAALELLRHVQNRMQGIRTLSAVCTFTLTAPVSGSKSHALRTMRESMRVRLSRPNLARVETSLASYDPRLKRRWERNPHFQTDASDGAFYWRTYRGSHEFLKWKVDPAGHEVRMFNVLPLDGFFNPEEFVMGRIPLLKAEQLLRGLTLDRRTIWNDASYRVVRLVYRRVGAREMRTERYFVGKDLLIHHIDASSSNGDRHASYDMKGVRVNASMSHASFAYRPPADCHPMKDAAMPTHTPTADGKPVADFAVQDEGGKPLRLSDYRGKVVVIDLWATWCGNCIQAFPQVNSIARRFKSQGVVVLAIDVGDVRDLFAKWVGKNNRYESLIFALDPSGVEGGGIYGAQFKGAGLPSTFVIGRDGRIAASLSGYDGNELELEAAVKSAVGPNGKE